jgi:hypothetical protein
MYDGFVQWSSEGIQIGSVGSAAGVIGCWAGATHDHGLSPLLILTSQKINLWICCCCCYFQVTLLDHSGCGRFLMTTQAMWLSLTNNY